MRKKHHHIFLLLSFLILKPGIHHGSFSSKTAIFTISQIKEVQQSFAYPFLNIKMLSSTKTSAAFNNNSAR